MAQTSGLVRPPVSMRVKVVVLLLAVIVLCTEVEAGNSAASIVVSAIVRNACTANTAAATEQVTAVATVSAAGDISVDCGIETPYSIAMNEGVISGATVSHGYTTSAAGTLAFNIYDDAAHTQAWGSFSGPDALSGTYRTLQAPLPVFGALNTDTSAGAANHERITMTVNY